MTQATCRAWRESPGICETQVESKSPRGRYSSVVDARGRLIARADHSSGDVGSYVWDLSSLYADDTAWEAERKAVTEQLRTIGRLKGALGRDAKGLADGLDEISDLRSRASKLAIYTFLVTAVDTQSEKAQAQYDAAIGLEPQVEAAVAFLPGEILAIGEERLRRWHHEQPRLDRHWIRIRRILREAPHTLPAPEQALVMSMSGWPRLSFDAFRALHDSDLGWPTMKNAEAQEVSVNLNTLSQFSGKERENAAKALLEYLRPLENTFGLLYTRRIEADLTIARHRRFDEGMDAQWFLYNGMPEGSHHIMLEIALANRQVFRRYLELRARALDLSRTEYGDLYITPPDISRFPITDAMEIAVAASAPFGPAYQQRLRDRMQAKWMHLPPLPGKRAFFAVYPPVSGSHPYFVMNYRSDYRSSRAFVGGVTELMAFGDIPPDRAPDTRDDPGIYANAVIYAGEMLHDDYLRSHAANRLERISYAVSSLDLFWRSCFQWTLMAELDTKVEQLVVAGRTPTGSQISSMYLALLRDYFGGPEGIAVLEDVFAREWMMGEVPFLSYEHQFWPPAMAAAVQIVEGLRAGNPNAIRAVTSLLGRGEDDRSYQLFRHVGIDLATPAPYQAVVRRMTTLLDELENGLAGT